MKQFVEFVKWFIYSLNPANGGFSITWNTLDKDIRFIGFREEYYDGSFYCFGFWFWHIVLNDNTTNPPTWKSHYEIREAIKEILKDPALIESDLGYHLLSDNRWTRFYTKEELNRREQNKA